MIFDSLTIKIDTVVGYLKRTSSRIQVFFLVKMLCALAKVSDLSRVLLTSIYNFDLFFCSKNIKVAKSQNVKSYIKCAKCVSSTFQPKQCLA